MLVAFPIALYTATFVALLAYVGTDDLFWYRAALAANVGGLIMAACAIIPGAIDLFTLPRHSAARATGLKHAGFNLVSTVLFLVNAIVMWHEWNTRVQLEGRYYVEAAAPLALSIIGLLALVVAGALGWTLVQTHHVGIADVADARPPLSEDELEPWLPPQAPGDTTGRHSTLRGVNTPHDTLH
jgi:uncharacterized membrane protein